MIRRRSTLLVLLLLAASAAAPASAQVPMPPLTPESQSSVEPVVAAQGSTLSGLFAMKKGVCASAGVTSGSYFRMYDPGGGLVTNGSSPCGDKTFTSLSPGRDGGISTLGYQPHPTPEFDGSGNGTNTKITQPEAFYGTRFSTATNSRDPQTTTNVPAPKILHDGAGKLSGDVRAFAAAWQNQHFNQGAPKPDGSSPGGTAALTGTFDQASGAFTIEWKSHIVGGPFNNFTGLWHFEGTFQSGQVAASQAANPGQQVVGAGSTSRTLSTTGPPFSATLALVLVLASLMLFAADALLSRREVGE